MEQLEGFIINGQENKVCKLDKLLYGLKQAPRNDMKKITRLCCQIKLKSTKLIKCIYMKNTDKGYVIVYLYMEYILIVASNDHMIKSTKNMLTKHVWHEILGCCKCHTMNKYL